MKEVFVIAGPNGAGKTTAAFTLLPNFIGVEEYVNADSLAYGLSPFHPDAVAIQAGRLMLDRIYGLIQQDRSFAFETTLASRSFIQLLQECKQKGYKTNLIFLWLPTIELAVHRVKLRVEQGGHFTPAETIERRYKRGLENLFQLYMPRIDNWWLYDNSSNVSQLVGLKLLDRNLQIFKPAIWDSLKSQHDKG